MGWSDGGITALIMACNYHDSVRKLVVWGGNAFITDEDIEMYESKSGFANNSPFSHFLS